MARFLKNHAKAVYVLFGLFGFFFIVAACFFVTPYTNVAVNYNRDVLDGVVTSIKTKNDSLVLFCKNTGFVFDDMYQTLYNFDKELQVANNMYMNVGVVSLLMLVVMAICSNATRKKYYISNLVSGIVCPIVSIVMAIVAMTSIFTPISTLTQQFEKINWGALGNQVSWETAAQQYLASPKDTSAFSISTIPLIIFLVILVVFIVASGLLIAYNAFRYLDTKKELTGKAVGKNA